MSGLPVGNTPREQAFDWRGILQIFEDIFYQPRSIDWDCYRSAVEKKYDPRFRGPDFLSISPCRSATTWLFRQLSRNPSVYLPAVKETNFFVSEWMGGCYERFFSGWSIQQSAGDISPNYSLLPRRAIAEFARAWPEARLLCMLRNPIDRVWSQIIFDLTRRNGCLRVPHAAVAGLPEQTFLSLAAFYSALNRYDFILQRWLEVYPASQIHVDFFDAVSTTPELLMRRICKFLGVPHCGVAEVGRVNAVRYDSIVMPQSVRNFLMEVYEPQLDGLNQLLQARFGLAVPAGWRTGAASGRKRVKVIGNYRGCDTWFECGSYQLMRHGASEIKSPEFWKALPMVGRNDEEVLETLMAWLCDNRRDDEGPKLMTSFRNHNLVAFRGQVYAIPHAIGVWDRWDVEDPKALPGVLVGPSMHVMKALLSEQPGLVRLPDVTIETSRR